MDRVLGLISPRLDSHLLVSRVFIPKLPRYWREWRCITKYSHPYHIVGILSFPNIPPMVRLYLSNIPNHGQNIHQVPTLMRLLAPHYLIPWHSITVIPQIECWQVQGVATNLLRILFPAMVPGQWSVVSAYCRFVRLFPHLSCSVHRCSLKVRKDYVGTTRCDGQ